MKNSLFGPAVIAGIIGGIIVDAFLVLVTHNSIVQIWQFVASSLVGQGAYASPSYAILGFVVHFIVSIVWAVLYVAAANALNQTRNWIVGGIVWGVVVDAVMYAILAVKLGLPFVQSFEQGLLAHIVFYALPVSFYVARSAARARA